MSDWIEVDGKKYYEESYLELANKTAERRGLASAFGLPKTDREICQMVVDSDWDSGTLGSVLWLLVHTYSKATILSYIESQESNSSIYKDSVGDLLPSWSKGA